MQSGSSVAQPRLDWYNERSYIHAGSRVMHSRIYFILPRVGG